MNNSKKKLYIPLSTSYGTQDNFQKESRTSSEEVLEESSLITRLQSFLEPFTNLLGHTSYQAASHAPPHPSGRVKIGKFFIGSLITLGIVGTLAFEKFFFDNINAFFEGHTLAGDDIPTEGFLEHFSIDGEATSAIALGVTYLLILGDGLTSLLLVNPFTSFDETWQLFYSDKPLTKTQVEHRNEAQERASCLIKSGDLVLLQGLPLVTNFMYFSFASYPAVYGTQALLGDGSTPLGWTLFAGVSTCFAGIYGKHLIRSLRRMRAAWYTNDEHVVSLLWKNKHASLEALLRFTVVAGLCGSKAMFLFESMFGFAQPAAWIDWLILASATYSVFATRFLLVKDDLFPQHEIGFEDFCAQHRMCGEQDRLFGRNIKSKMLTIIQSLSKGIFPGWLAGSMVYSYTTSLQEEGQMALTATSGILTGALFCSSYYKILPRQFWVKVFHLHEQIIALCDGLGLDWHPAHLTSARRVVNLQRHQMTSYKKRCQQRGGNVSVAFDDYNEQLTIHHQTLSHMQRDFDHLMYLIDKFDRQVTSNAQPATTIQQALQFFHTSRAQWNRTKQHLPYLLATASNVIGNLAHQILLVHFCIVVVIKKFGVENNEENLQKLYNAALVFSASNGLSLFINGLAVYQEPLLLRYTQMVNRLGECCKGEEAELVDNRLLSIVQR